MSEDDKPPTPPPSDRPEVDSVFTKLIETYVPPAKDQ